MVTDTDRSGFPFRGGLYRRQTGHGVPSGRGDTRQRQVRVSIHRVDTKHKQFMFFLHGGGKPDTDRSGFPFREGSDTSHRQARVSLQGEVIPDTDGSGFPFMGGGGTRHRPVRVSIQGGVVPDRDRSGFPFSEG